MIRTVLFVCTGNTCRSPMAEGIMRNILLKNNRKEIIINSAGVMAMNGMPATTGAILVMAEMGIDISSHKSTKIRSDLLRHSDLILVMERYHHDALLHLVPHIENKVKLLKEYSQASPVDMDIDEPLGGTLEKYRECANEIKKCIEVVVDNHFKER